MAVGCFRVKGERVIERKRERERERERERVGLPETRTWMTCDDESCFQWRKVKEKVKSRPTENR